MAIQVTSFIVPKGGNTWYVLEDKYIKGGLQIAATTVERDAINSANRKSGMLVITSIDNKIWQMQPDLLAWKEFKVGGGSAVRQTVTFATKALIVGGQEIFDLPLGRSVLVYRLSVDTPCIVEAFESVERLETNPFKFVATSDHLQDDGSSLMTDGTVLRGRRYSILSNQEAGASATIYFRITNNDVVAKNVNLTLTFLPLEIL